MHIRLHDTAPEERSEGEVEPVEHGVDALPVDSREPLVFFAEGGYLGVL